MSNIDILYESDPTFGEIFNEWRVKRVKKLEEILGKKWFKDKKILELGCAYGNIGFYFKSLGADITFSDGRQKALDKVLQKDRLAKVILIDQDTDWKLDNKFDLIIHFGISYNINNWKQDLINTIKHAKYIAYETAVNRFNNDIEFKIKNYQYSHEYHGPINHIGSLVSVSMIENVFNNEKVKYKRYDDKDLNIIGSSFFYDLTDNISYKKDSDEIIYIESWNNHFVCGGRKYWLIKNN